MSWCSRLTVRKSETPEGLKLRIATARQELKHIGFFDYVVVNEDCHLPQHHRYHRRHRPEPSITG